MLQKYYENISYKNSNLGLGHVIEIIPYDANFGTVVSYGTSGLKTFEVTPSASVTAKMQKYIDAGYLLYGRVLGGTGQYGIPFSYNADNTNLNNGLTTFNIMSDVVSISNASHTVAIRMNIAILAEKM